MMWREFLVSDYIWNFMWFLSTVALLSTSILQHRIVNLYNLIINKVSEKFNRFGKKILFKLLTQQKQYFLILKMIYTRCINLLPYLLLLIR